MEYKKMYKVAIITGIIGLILILSVMVSNPSYLNMFFSIVALLGIVLIFASVVLLGISWLLYIKDSIKKRNYIEATIIIILGLLIIIRAFIKYL